MNRKLLVVSIFWLFTVGLVSAVTVEVEPGTDAISAAFMEVFPNDTIVLKEGMYIETSTMNTPGFKVTIIGVPGQTVWKMNSAAIPKRRPAMPTVEGSEFSVAIYVKKDLCLENIIFDFDSVDIGIENAYGSVTPGEEYTADKNNIFIDHCELRNIGMYIIHVYNATTEDDISLYDVAFDKVNHPVDTLSVTNSLFYNSGYMGIRSNHAMVRVFIAQNCTFWHIDRENIKIYGPVSVSGYMKYFVDHCTFFDIYGPNAARGIYIRNSDEGDIIQNSIFYKCRDQGISARSGNFLLMTVQYCIGDSCDNGVYGGIQSILRLCLEENPMFTDPDNGDFSLQEGSLAIGWSTDGSDCGNPITNWTHVLTSVEEPKIVPESFALNQNYPNPFNPNTNISYSLDRTGHVSLDIYSFIGQKVRTLINRVESVGSHSVVWNSLDDKGNSVAAGIYFCRIQSGSSTETRKMVLIK